MSSYGAFIPGPEEFVSELITFLFETPREALDMLGDVLANLIKNPRETITTLLKMMGRIVDEVDPSEKLINLILTLLAPLVGALGIAASAPIVV